MRSPVILLSIALLLFTGNTHGSETAADWSRQVETSNRLVEAGRFDEAAAVYASALERAHAVGDHQGAGVILQNLGRLLDRRGQLREAERAYLRAIGEFAGAVGTDERLVLRAAAGLSATYLQTAQYSRAEALIKDMLTRYPGGADSDRASLLGILGVTLAHRQHFSQAERLLRQTVEMCEQEPNEEMQQVRAIALGNLGGLQMLSGRVADSIVSYREALAIMTALPEPSPAALAATLGDYANALCASGENKAAEEAFLRSIAIAEARLGPNHQVLGHVLQDYAVFVRKAGSKAKARELSSAARRIQNEWDRENMTGHTVDFRSLLRKR